jgi:hypothetical protein
MHIREKATDGAFKDYVVRKTYEDAYTLEMKELYAVVTEDKPIKTTAEDARHDIEIFGMIMKAVAQSQRPVTMPGVNGEVNGGPKGMNGIDGVRRANLPEV